MYRSFLTGAFLFFFPFSFVQAQAVADKLARAWAAFASDSQLRSGIASLYVMNAATGEVVFERNGYTGLAPASTQKVITAATAYEILGTAFRYTTRFAYGGNSGQGRLIVQPSGDPTLGSWRWKQTGEDAVLRRVVDALQKTGVRRYDSMAIEAPGWDSEAVPGGWIWDDIGNYYGAGAEALNWRENQYDLFLRSGAAVGGPVVITGTKPALYTLSLQSKLRAAPKGTGDNAYIYFSRRGTTGVVRGTIPVGEEAFTISGAMPGGGDQFLATLADSLARRGIRREKGPAQAPKQGGKNDTSRVAVFHTESSPPLDSIVYWFLRRSINLYGEALAKTVAAATGKPATTADGAATIQNHWSKKDIGIDKTELNVYDGSGLSPLNRTTAHAQAAILYYAQTQPWFSGYYQGFPEFNGMKLKSGTISDVKSFAGYHTSKSGAAYVVSFIVNNYNGSAAALVQKMYRVLDLLK